MSPELGLAIMMNNYFHDVATALLVGSAFSLWAMVRVYDEAEAPQTRAYLLRIYERMTKLGRFSLAWIMIGGVPRLIYFMDFEWVNAVGKLQVPALALKHTLIFIAVAAGARLWWQLRKRMAVIRASFATS